MPANTTFACPACGKVLSYSQEPCSCGQAVAEVDEYVPANTIGRVGDWYVASDTTGTLLYLTSEQLASDIPERAWTGDAVTARNLCIAQNRDKTWGKIHWHYAPIATLGLRD